MECSADLNITLSIFLLLMSLYQLYELITFFLTKLLAMQEGSQERRQRLAEYTLDEFITGFLFDLFFGDKRGDDRIVIIYDL